MSDFKVVTVGAPAAAYIPLAADNTINYIVNEVVERLAKRIKPDNEPRYYSRKEAAALLHITLPTLHQMVKDGKITAKKVGKRILFEADAIEMVVKDKAVPKQRKKRC